MDSRQRFVLNLARSLAHTITFTGKVLAGNSITVTSCKCGGGLILSKVVRIVKRLNEICEQEDERSSCVCVGSSFCFSSGDAMRLRF